MAIAGVTHNVYRNATAPVPMDDAHRIASGLRVGLYLDRGGRAGLYYVVTAQNAAGESGPSNTARAQPLWPWGAGHRGPGLPLQWPDLLLLLPAPLLLLALGRSRQRKWAAPVGAVLLGVAAVCLGAGLLLSGGAEAAVAPGNAGAEEMVTRVITYTYDPLHRLTGAEYSTGERYEYQYDALSNVTVMTETVTATIVTHYTYNAANQLLTARRSDDGITWHYTFDRRGNLTRQTPGGTAPAEGETRYAYNAAGQLVRVELYTAGAYITLAEATYDADGERVRLTTWAEGAPFTVTYGVFQGQLLASTTGPTVTLYLQGRALIGEYRDGWTYPLRDGEGSVRQEVDGDGDVVLARFYKPFGGILEERGQSGTAFGFLGAQLDRISGLLYAGGRYYDPATGRYLTPGRGFDPYHPRTLNPYVPMQDPGLWLLAPLGVVAALVGRKRRRGGWWLWVLLVLLAGVGVSGVLLVGCAPPTPTPTPPVPPSQPPTQPPTPTPTPTPMPTPTPSSLPIPPGRIVTLPPLECTVEGPYPNKVAYITLDDGPGGYTEATLDVLRENGYQIGVTYFLHGKNIAGHEGTVARIRSEGHGIGNHSWGHEEWYAAFNANDYVTMSELIDRTENAIQMALGDSTFVSGMFRSPGGSLVIDRMLNNQPIIEQVPGHSLWFHYGWYVDTKDWWGDEAENAVKRAMEEIDKGWGDNNPIILMHSTHSHAPEVLRGVIDGLRQRGFVKFGVLPRPGDSPDIVYHLFVR